MLPLDPAVVSLSLELVLLLVLVCIGLVAFSFERSVRWTAWHAPFVPVRPEILDTVVKTLALTPSSLLYDLGCGDARVVCAAQRHTPQAKCVGVEINLFPYTLACLRKRILGREYQNLLLSRTDFFSVPLTSATHIFLYLTTSVLDNLYPKFVQELRPGTRVITCDFQFSQKQPLEVIDLPKNRLNSKLYVYEF